MESKTELMMLVDEESLFFKERLVKHQLKAIADSTDILTNTCLFEQYHRSTLSFQGAAVLLENGWLYQVEQACDNDATKVEKVICGLKRLQAENPTRNLIVELVMHALLHSASSRPLTYLVACLLGNKLAEVKQELDFISEFEFSYGSLPCITYTNKLPGILYRELYNRLKSKGFMPLSQTEHLLSLFEYTPWLFEGCLLPWIPTLSDTLDSSRYQEYVELCHHYQIKVLKALNNSQLLKGPVSLECSCGYNRADSGYGVDVN